MSVAAVSKDVACSNLLLFSQIKNGEKLISNSQTGEIRTDNRSFLASLSRSDWGKFDPELAAATFQQALASLRQEYAEAVLKDRAFTPQSDSLIAQLFEEALKGVKALAETYTAEKKLLKGKILETCQESYQHLFQKLVYEIEARNRALAEQALAEEERLALTLPALPRAGEGTELSDESQNDSLEQPPETRTLAAAVFSDLHEFADQLRLPEGWGESLWSLASTVGAAAKDLFDLEASDTEHSG